MKLYYEGYKIEIEDQNGKQPDRESNPGPPFPLYQLSYQSWLVVKCDTSPSFEYWLTCKL